MNDATADMALILLAVYALIWLTPLLIISRSSKTSGSEKVAWVIAMLFVSWGAFVFYLLLAPLKKR